MEFFPAFLRYVLYAISFFCAIEIFTVQSSYQRKRAYLFAVMAALVLGISGLFSYLRIKGVTLFDTNYLSMMLLSLVVWLSCFFIYKEPISKRFFNILTATAGRNIGAKIASVIFYFWEIENPYLASFFQFFVVMVCLAPLYWFIGRKIKKDSSYVPPGRDLLLGFIVMIAFAKNNCDKVIVIVNSSNPLELSSLASDDGINAILWVGTTGSRGFRSMAKILTGEVNPSGRLTDLYAKSFIKDPVYQNFGEYLYSNDSAFTHNPGMPTMMAPKTMVP